TQSGTIALGTLPGSITDPTKVAVKQDDHNVYIVNSFGATLSVWDGGTGHNNGQVDGGDGIWDVTNDNWTDPDGNMVGSWHNGDYAVFGGTGGKVSVDDGQGAVSASGMQFAVGGYEITGAELKLVDMQNNVASTIRVGVGNADDKDLTATISAGLTNIVGAHGMNKTGDGTLILSGTNTYNGGTTISGGVL
ncbi:autotransporter-associated beta strand repeat-containing protein, partial [Brucella anthropi]|uniref:autotransporter-associated beta strand repeat-containing protein n=1 Tax=Brucella anthropi TaxID=529 RepID=UPI00235DEA16